MASAALSAMDAPVPGTRVSRQAAADLARIAAERGIAPDLLASEILDAGLRDYARDWDAEVTPQMIADAEAALAEGASISHEEIEERMRGWLARLPA